MNKTPRNTAMPSRRWGVTWPTYANHVPPSNDVSESRGESAEHLLYGGEWRPFGFGAGIPDAEFTPDWRQHLFDHISAMQMLQEVADALYGVAEVRGPRPRPAQAGEDMHPAATLTLQDVIEGVRRVLLFKDPRRRGVARASAEQVCALAERLMRDAARERASVEATHTDTDAWGLGDARDVSEPASSGFVDIRLGSHPLSLMSRMPSAWVAGGVAVAVAVRSAMKAAGAAYVNVATPKGEYHVCVIEPETSAGLHNPRPPVVLLHGMFTTSVSMMPLAVLLADACGRTVFVPDHLDFDFGFSRTWERARQERDAQGSPAAHVSPLRWGDHVEAVHELLRALSSSMSYGPAFDVVGHSFGGFVAQKLAHRFPVVVRKLVLLCPGGLGRYRMLSSAAPLTGFQTTTEILAQRLPRPLATAAAYIFDIVTRSPFTVHMVSTLDYEDYFRPGCVVHQPTLLLWGTDDDLHRVWVVRHADTLLRDTPAGHGFWIHGGNHAINVDSLLSIEQVAVPFLLEGSGGREHVSTSVHTLASVLRVAARATGGAKPVTPMQRTDAVPATSESAAAQPRPRL